MLGLGGIAKRIHRVVKPAPAHKIGDTVPLPPNAYTPGGAPNPEVFIPQSTAQFPAVMPGDTAMRYASQPSIFAGQGIGMQPSQPYPGWGGGASAGDVTVNGWSWKDYLSNVGTYAAVRTVDRALDATFGDGSSWEASYGYPPGSYAPTAELGLTYSPSNLSAGPSPMTLLLIAAVLIFLMVKAF